MKIMQKIVNISVQIYFCRKSRFLMSSDELNRVFEIVSRDLIHNLKIKPKRFHHTFTLAFPFYARKNKGKETEFARKFGYKVYENALCKTYTCEVYTSSNIFVAHIFKTRNVLTWHYDNTTLRTHTKIFSDGGLVLYTNECAQMYAWNGSESYFLKSSKRDGWVGRTHNRELEKIAHIETNICDVVDKWKDDWLDFKRIMIRNTLFPANIKDLSPSDLFKMAWNDVPLNF